MAIVGKSVQRFWSKHCQNRIVEYLLLFCLPNGSGGTKSEASFMISNHLKCTNNPLHTHKRKRILKKIVTRSQDYYAPWVLTDLSIQSSWIWLNYFLEAWKMRALKMWGWGSQDVRYPEYSQNNQRFSLVGYLLEVELNMHWKVCFVVRFGDLRPILKCCLELQWY